MVLDNWISTCQNMKLDPDLTQYVKTNSKWIEDLDVKAKSIKPLEGNRGVNIHDLGLGNNFLNVTPKAQPTNEK